MMIPSSSSRSSTTVVVYTTSTNHGLGIPTCPSNNIVYTTTTETMTNVVVTKHQCWWRWWWFCCQESKKISGGDEGWCHGTLKMHFIDWSIFSLETMRARILDQWPSNYFTLFCVVIICSRVVRSTSLYRTNTSQRHPSLHSIGGGRSVRKR